ncbi:hypothetical protein [Streptosporangium sp. NPDC002524]|uniref:hypothetical protein n=1 Tax=Streptosporangium sp. NPDC002524 TaxID=3154537 RepID=UPI0033172D61
MGLRLYGDRPDPFPRSDRFELVAHSRGGWEVATVTVGERSGYFVVSLPSVGVAAQMVNVDQPYAVVGLILAALVAQAGQGQGMTGAALTPTPLRVPYVIAHAGEAVPQRLRFARRPLGRLRLVYDDPRRGDMACGVLRARVLNNRQGAPQWRKLNTLRQWRCMLKNLCQVCGQDARDPATGRVPWITTATAFRVIPDVPNSGYTSAPATCRACIPESLGTCPRLHMSSAVYTVARSEPAAVLADMFSPGPGGLAVHTGEHNVLVGLNEPHLLRSALATQLLVRIDDMRPLKVA